MESPFIIKDINFVNWSNSQVVHPQICIMKYINEWISAHIPGHMEGNLSTISTPLELKSTSLGPGFYMCCTHIPQNNGEHVDILEKQMKEPGGIFIGPSYNYICKSRFFLVTTNDCY